MGRSARGRAPWKAFVALQTRDGVTVPSAALTSFVTFIQIRSQSAFCLLITAIFKDQPI
jgi:hypothetical protein